MFAKSSESNVKLVLVNIRTPLVFLSLLYRMIPSCVNIFHVSGFNDDATLLQGFHRHTRLLTVQTNLHATFLNCYSSHLNNFFVRFCFTGWYVFFFFLVDTEIVTDSLGGEGVVFCKIFVSDGFFARVSRDFYAV